SYLPFPSIKARCFGLIQEELAHKPFQLLIAVIFLNKTNGAKAIPKFREFIKRYPGPDELAHANLLDVTSMIRALGLFKGRSQSLIELAKLWLVDPPRAGRRHRTLNYPFKGASKNIKKDEIVDDADPRVGAFEIGHLPGCGPYALDSWRIFCRDVLRGVALDWNGAGTGDEGFEPEWKRVRPDDKELRAYLKWMWLREGWEWDPETGKKTLAKEEKIRLAE
ncbi:DNA glycosylase, partial [Macrophomina phaseolina]